MLFVAHYLAHTSCCVDATVYFIFVPTELQFDNKLRHLIYFAMRAKCIRFIWTPWRAFRCTPHIWGIERYKAYIQFIVPKRQWQRLQFSANERNCQGCWNWEKWTALEESMKLNTTPCFDIGVRDAYNANIYEEFH